MTYTVIKNLAHFEFWSGAKDNALKFTYEEMEKLDELLDDWLTGSEAFGQPIPTETQINDLFWFEMDFICNLLGYTWDDENAQIIRELI